MRIDGAPQPISARIGAGLAPTVSDTAISLRNLSGVDLNVRNIAAEQVPARFFGRDRLKTADMVALTSTFIGHRRADRVEWKGGFTLRNFP